MSPLHATIGFWAALAAILPMQAASPTPAADVPAGVSPSPAPSSEPSSASSPTPTPTPTPTPEPLFSAVVGQIYDHLGGGVQGVAVMARDKASGKVVCETSTNEFGDFRIETKKQPAGPLELVFSKQLWNSASYEVKEFNPEQPVWIDHAMIGACAVRGTVTDAVSRKPIQDAVVEASVAYTKWGAKTDAEGKFAVENLPPGRVAVSVQAEGYAKEMRMITAVESSEPQEIELSPERIVEFLVVNPDGKPVPQAHLEFYIEQENDFRHVVTNAEGKATARGLSMELEELKLRLTHPDFVSSLDFDRDVTLPMDRSKSEHTLTMLEAGAIAGAVLMKEDESPLGGARLTVGEVMNDLSPQAWSEPDGSYRITGVKPGKAVVTVHFMDRAPELFEVNVAPGGTTERKVLMGPGTVIRGRVVDEDGKGLERVHVYAVHWRDYETLGLRAVTDEEGGFEIVDAPDDPVELSFYLPGWEPLLEKDVKAADPAKTYTLKEAEEPSSSPKFAAGAPAPDFEVDTLAGEKLSLKALKGKVVLLDFWATWCGPCVAEIPKLKEIRKAYADNPDFVLVSISLDDEESRLKRAVDEREMDWTHVFGKQASEVADAYRVQAIPSMFVIDRDGKLVGHNLGSAGLTEKIDQALEAKASE